MGEGEFGCCVRGEYRGDMVAVKSTKDTVEVAAFKDFLREVKIMAYIGSHDNIVEFIGAQVSSIDQSKIMRLIIEGKTLGIDSVHNNVTTCLEWVRNRNMQSSPGTESIW